MRPRGSLVGPLVLITIGILFLLHTVAPSIEIAQIFSRYWPYLLIVLGLVQIVEITARYTSNKPLPTNGISGGSWALIILVCIAGFGMFEFHRADTWWRRAGIEQSVEMLGEAHHFDVEPQRRDTGKRPKLVIDKFRGNIHLVGTEEQRIELRADKTIHSLERSDAERADKASPVEMVGDESNVVIRCNQSRAKGRTNLATNLDLQVPYGTTIEVTGQSGSFDISHLGGEVTLHGDTNSVNLDQVDGDVRIDMRHGNLVHCSNVKGGVSVQGRGSDIELNKIAGEVSVEGNFGGTLTLKELAKPLRLQNSHLELSVVRLPGQIRMDRGSLSGSNLIGPVRMNGRSIDVELLSFSGKLDLNIDKGDVDLRPLPAALGEMNVRTSSGDIELALPTTAKFDLKAVTDRGEIENEFSQALTLQQQRKGAKLEGTLGGGPLLNVTTDRGSITIRKATAADQAVPDVDEKTKRDEDDNRSSKPKSGSLVLNFARDRVALMNRFHFQNQATLLSAAG